MGEAVSISYKGGLMGPAELARRYRVLAALHPQGVTVTHSREELLSKAKAFDAIDTVLRADPSVVVVEVDRPIPRFAAVLLCGSLTLSAFGFFGDAAWALLRWVGWVA
ncbi:hypothetical protein [Pseudotabrizicola algicola]|uniref:Uncharacterized protein n=1 Tax=Pseudotabrizicola algicola TaxID=2709381 RepID=A0A6B3RJB5_9RHOB|nr:hypothetical protein [Pseudotabrizicola algicola]NEX45203.1 hypothetical protein [Pseudotabrizicola algicola]